MTHPTVRLDTISDMMSYISLLCDLDAVKNDPVLYMDCKKQEAFPLKERTPTPDVALHDVVVATTTGTCPIAVPSYDIQESITSRLKNIPKDLLWTGLDLLYRVPSPTLPAVPILPTVSGSGSVSQLIHRDGDVMVVTVVIIVLPYAQRIDLIRTIPNSGPKTECPPCDIVQQ